MTRFLIGSIVFVVGLASVCLAESPAPDEPAAARADASATDDDWSQKLDRIQPCMLPDWEEEADNLLNEAMAADRLDILPGLANQLSERPGWLHLRKYMSDKLTVAQGSADAKTSLSKDPTSNLANQKVGLYYCLLADNWTKGLPMLALAGEPVLRRLAEQELAAPSDANKQLELATMWFDWGESQQQGCIQDGARMRAEHWYKKCATASCLELTQARDVSHRLKELLLLRLRLRISCRSRLRLKVSDELLEAQAKAITFLWSKQKPDGSWDAFNKYHVGPTSLIVYALLASGECAKSDKMAKALDWLSINKAMMTYELGLRANAWLIANRTTDGKYRRQLDADAKILEMSTADGSYGYPSTGKPTSGDNSNSQYGLLGLWAAARSLTYEVSDEYWWKVMRHWQDSQNRDGGWGYGHHEPSNVSMTCAAISSLLICSKELHFLPPYVKRPLTGPLVRALEWLELNISSDTSCISYPCMLLSLARVGDLLEQEVIAGKAWYQIGVEHFMKRQNPDGSIDAGNPGDTTTLTPAINTALALVFMAYGTHKDGRSLYDRYTMNDFVFMTQKATHVSFAIALSNNSCLDNFAVLKTRLIAAVESMEPSQYFQICTGTEAIPNKGSLLATPDNKKTAINFIKALRLSKSDRYVLERSLHALHEAKGSTLLKRVIFVADTTSLDNNFMDTRRLADKGENIIIDCYLHQAEQWSNNVMKQIATESGGTFTAVDSKSTAAN